MIETPINSLVWNGELYLKRNDLVAHCVAKSSEKPESKDVYMGLATALAEMKIERVISTHRINKG